VRHGLAQAALAGAHPESAFGAGHQETRGVALTAQVFFVAERAEVVVTGIAVARLAVGRADAVAELRDLQRRPVELRQCRDQSGYHAGLTHAPRMSPDDYDGHDAIFAGFARFKKFGESKLL